MTHSRDYAVAVVRFLGRVLLLVPLAGVITTAPCEESLATEGMDFGVLGYLSTTMVPAHFNASAVEVHLFMFLL